MTSQEISMPFNATQYARKGVIQCNASVEEVFPLLCPKREEDWIPGWKCETIWSHSGYNEQGAIFRTLKPYGTELYWTTLQYDMNNRVVDFLITAPRLYMLRYTIELSSIGDGSLSIAFGQVFTSITEEGDMFIQRYKTEDFAGRLKNLEKLLCNYLESVRK
jgi:hypothetical protein